MGGVRGFATQTDELVSVATQLTAAATHARTHLHLLDTTALITLDRWRGPAGQDFAVGWHDWHAGAAELIDALDAMAAAVAQAGRDYAVAEAAVQAVVRETPA